MGGGGGIMYCHLPLDRTLIGIFSGLFSPIPTSIPAVLRYYCLVVVVNQTMVQVKRFFMHIKLLLSILRLLW